MLVESKDVDTYRSKSDRIRHKARVIVVTKGKSITLRGIEQYILYKLSKSEMF